MSRKLALIIGNSEYDDKNLAQLLTPGADVNALAEVLRDQEIGGFDEVAALVNQTAAKIRRSVSGFFAGRGRDDLMVLYFSGHGIRDDRGQLFLAVKDTEHKLLRATAIRASFITEEMDNSRSRRQVLILDCCHSGAFSRGMKAAPGISVGTAAAFEGTGSGRVVLTATDSTQYAWEGDQVIGQAVNSVFTRFLIQGLRTGEADTDADGRITLDELYDYVFEQVVSETPRQTPSKWSYGQQGELVIARNPHPVVRPAELPPDLQQTLDDLRPWVREGAVHELDRLLRGSHPGLALSAHEALKRLTNDDSRRVATMAAESLASYGEMQHIREEAAARPEAQIRQSAKEDQERHARKRAARKTGVQDKAEQERLARERTERDRLARDSVKLEREARERAAQPAVTAKRADALREMKWFPIMLTSIGWFIGMAAGVALNWALPELGWTIRATIIGIIGGFATGLVLGRTGLSIRWKQILIITIGWAISWAIDSVFAFPGRIISAAIRGTIGGFATGTILERVGPSIHWKRILIVTIGWVIGWAMGDSIGGEMIGLIVDSFGNSAAWWAMYWGIMAAISGAIGSIVMYWQLGQMQGDNSTV